MDPQRTNPPQTRTAVAPQEKRAKKPTRFTSRWLVTGGIAATSLAYTFLVFMPAQQGIAELRSELVEKQNYVTSANNLPKQMESLQEDIERTQAYIDTWQERVPAESQLAAVYQRVVESVAQSGMTTLQFDPQEPVHHRTVMTVPLAVSVDGRFPQLIAMLSQVEQLEHLVWVESVQIGPSAKNEKHVQCDIHFVVFADRDENSDELNQSNIR